MPTEDCAPTSALSTPGHESGWPNEDRDFPWGTTPLFMTVTTEEDRALYAWSLDLEGRTYDEVRLSDHGVAEADGGD